MPPDTPDEERRLVTAMAAELEAIARTGLFELRLTGITALQLAGLIQLAMRHPAMHDENPHRGVAALLLAHVRAYFAGCPAVLHILARGDDPAEDVH